MRHPWSRAGPATAPLRTASIARVRAQAAETREQCGMDNALWSTASPCTSCDLMCSPVLARFVVFSDF